MIRLAGAQIYKISFHSTHTLQNVRRICVNSCVQWNKSRAEELAEKKRKEQIERDRRWTKLYHFTDIKYHAIVTRLKIYPYIATGLLSPCAYLVELSQVYPEFYAAPCLIVGKFRMRQILKIKIFSI